MKTLLIILLILSSFSVYAQTKINILDENTKRNTPIFTYERMDGSVFELNGNTNWSILKLFPSSEAFAKLINAKKPIIVEFETMDGNQYLNINGGNWKKTQKRAIPQENLGLSVNYNRTAKILDVNFKILNTSLIEINLHQVYGINKILLHNKYEEHGQHRIKLSVAHVPAGEYVLVLRTPQKAETFRLSITN